MGDEVVSGGDEVVEVVSAGDEVVEVVSGDALSSEKLKAVVTSVKNFRWIMPWDPEHPRGFIVGKNMWSWVMFGSIPQCSIMMGIPILLGDPIINNWLLIPDMILLILVMITHHALLISIIYWCRDMPFRLIGAKAKFKLEVIPMIIAAAFHQLLEFNFLEINYGYFCIILGITTYFYTIAHFMRVAYDIGGKDVLFGLILLVLAYFLKGGLLVRGLGLSLCVVLCFYRYVTYPELPEHGKKELERLPC